MEKETGNSGIENKASEFVADPNSQPNQKPDVSKQDLAIAVQPEDIVPKLDSMEQSDPQASSASSHRWWMVIIGILVLLGLVAAIVTPILLTRQEGTN